MATETRVWPDLAIPPGELLAETLEEIGMTQAELARRAERPPQAINEIVKGVKEITPETALQLERVLGVPAHVWVTLEANYQFNKARLADEEQLHSERPLASKYPYGAMAKHGWVPRTKDPLTRTKALLHFFGVTSFRAVRLTEPVAFRRTPKANASPEALAAWLRQGERVAQTIATKPFREEALRGTIPELRALTARPPGEFQPRAIARLAASGVAFAVVAHLPRTYAQGATRWLKPDKALVQTSIRYKWDDIFWFSLFHEIGHILLHGKDTVFIEYGTDGDNEQEQEANQFACDQLIPPPAYREFLARTPVLTKEAVRAFAREQGIAASIVVGRLQHEGRLPYARCNDLRTRFRLVPQKDQQKGEQ